VSWAVFGVRSNFVTAATGWAHSPPLESESAIVRAAMIHRFGGFELDEERFELRSAGAPVRLEPRVLELLLHLARHPGRVVSKEELVREVWHGKFVSDSAVTYAVAEARRALALGRDAAIENVHGRGYRLVAEVAAAKPTETAAVVAPAPPVAAPSTPPPTLPTPPITSPAATGAPPPATGRTRTVLLALGLLLLAGFAALRFAHPSAVKGADAATAAKIVSIVLATPEIPEGDADLHLLGVSLLDALRARLAQVAGLRVLAEPDPLRTADACSLTLSLARDPRNDRGQLRVFLDDPAGGRRPPGRFPIGRYDVAFLTATRDLERFNAVREEIARRLVEILLPAVQLSPVRPGLVPRDPEAYRLYLVAQDRIAATSCDNESFVDMLHASLDRDESFAPAWEVLGWEEYGLVAFCGGDKRHYATALASAEHALALVPDSAAAVLLKMSVLNENDRWVEAWQTVDSAAREGLAPAIAAYARSYLFDYVGEVARARASLEESVTADPLFLTSQGWAPNALLYARQEERYLELLPAATSPFMRYLRGVALARLGRPAEAQEVLRPAFAANPGDLYARMSEALLLVLEGDRDGALTILRALDEQRRRLGSSDGETTFWLAGLYARVGDTARTLDTLELAASQGFVCAACLDSAPEMAHLGPSRRLDELRAATLQQASQRLRQAGLAP
jgi:DNA-binding winged helix-turn-helix (wHTH) protein/tetratricopeptide (TPR) repeat protein